MKIEFVKETKMDGELVYYTKVNDRYTSNSLSYRENEARELFERIKKDGPNALNSKMALMEHKVQLVPLEIVESFEFKVNEEK